MSTLDSKENEALAEVLIDRLNAMIDEDPEVGTAMGLLIKHRVMLPSLRLKAHPTIQVSRVNGSEETGPIEVGFLGMLNGIVGTIPDGDFKGWGYVMAIVEEDGSVSRFINTKHKKQMSFAR